MVSAPAQGSARARAGFCHLRRLVTVATRHARADDPVTGSDEARDPTPTRPVARKRSWRVVSAPAQRSARARAGFCHLRRLVTVATRYARADDPVTGSHGQRRDRTCDIEHARGPD